MEFRRRRNRIPLAHIATGERYGDYVMVSMDDMEKLLDSALPTVGTLVQEQGTWTRPGRSLLKDAFARELGVDSEELLTCQLIAYLNEYGYACRRFEETMLEHEDQSAALLTYLMTAWAIGDPALPAWRLVHRAAARFALHATTDATGELSYHLLPGVNHEVRASIQKRTIRTVLDLFGGRLRGGVTAPHVVQLWEYGFVERYAEMSMPAISGLVHGDFPARVPAADLALPPPGVR